MTKTRAVVATLVVLMSGCGAKSGSTPANETTRSALTATAVTTDQTSYPSTLGTAVVVTWTGMPGYSTDWIGIAAQGSDDGPVVEYHFTGGLTSGSLSFSSPGGGTWVARAYPNYSHTKVAESAPFTVAAAPTVSTDQTSYPSTLGTAVVVTWTGMPGYSTDWIGIAAQGSDDGPVVAYQFTGGLTSGSLSFSPGSGTWVARAYPNYSHTKVAESAPFVIEPGGASGNSVGGHAETDGGAGMVGMAGAGGSAGGVAGAGAGGASAGSGGAGGMAGAGSSGTTGGGGLAGGATGMAGGTVCQAATMLQTATFLNVPGTHGYVAAGDFDGNGKVDLAVTNSDGTVAVVLSNGDGTANPAVNYPAVPSPERLMSGDWNGDGKVDLVVVGYNAGVGVLLGNGDGTFAAPVPYATGRAAVDAVSGDWNGDGRADLAVTNSMGPSVSLLMGNGDGTFQKALNITVPSQPTSIVTADWNGDGKADLVVATFSFSLGSTVSLLLGNGDGTFSAPVNRVPGVYAGGRLIAGDLNGDRKVDLVIGNIFDDAVAVALGNGDGTFQAARTYVTLSGSSTPTGAYVQGLAVADLNGDGKVDLEAAVIVGSGGSATGHGVASVLLGNGDGTFQPATSYYAGPDPAHAVRIDWNGDGKDDLAVASSSAGIIAVLTGNGDGTYQSAPDYQTGADPASAVTGDWNGDAKDDLVVANLESNNNGSVSVFLGDGQGHLAPGVVYPVGAFPYAVVSGDWNRDGKLDLAVPNDTTGSGTGAVLLGHGDGTFGSATKFATSSAAMGLTTGDWNGDGKPDLATANAAAPGATVILGNGDGTFQVAGTYSTGGGSSDVISGDWNSDGKADLATADRTGGVVTVLLGGGDGTFTAKAYPAASGTRALTTGDWNGDGKPDLATANNDVHFVSVLLGNGDGTFQKAVAYDVGDGQVSLTTGDWNRDGKPDLAARTSTGFSVLLGRGDGTFQPAIQYFAGAGGAIVRGDWNADGRPDVAVTDYQNSRVALFLNRCP